jgi:hypothetical protein
LWPLPNVLQCAVVPSCEEAASDTVSSALHASLAVVAGDGPAAASRLFFSSGRGDLVLVSPHCPPGSSPAGSSSSVSAPAFPLRAPGALGVKPFSIEAAWRSSSSSLLRCVLSSFHNAASQGSQHASSKGWVSETWLVTLEAHSAAGASSSGQHQLRVVGCQLLHVSRTPPVAAVTAPAADRLLLVGGQGLDAHELPPGEFLEVPVMRLGAAACQRWTLSSSPRLLIRVLLCQVTKSSWRLSWAASQHHRPQQQHRQQQRQRQQRL